MRNAPPDSHETLINVQYESGKGIDKLGKLTYTVYMKMNKTNITESDVFRKYFAYYAFYVRTVDTVSDVQRDTFSVMAQAQTMSYFGHANRARVARIFDSSRIGMKVKPIIPA